MKKEYKTIHDHWLRDMKSLDPEWRTPFEWREFDLTQPATKAVREKVEPFGIQVQTVLFTTRAKTDRVHKVFSVQPATLVDD